MINYLEFSGLSSQWHNNGVYSSLVGNFVCCKREHGKSREEQVKQQDFHCLTCDHRRLNVASIVSNQVIEAIIRASFW